MSTSPVGPRDPSSSTFFTETFFAPVMQYFAHHPHKDFAVGCITGIAEVLVDQPLVSAKNILQKHISSASTNQSQTTASIWKTLTFKQLYAGAGANAAGSAITTGIQMGVISKTRKQLAGERDVQSLTTGEKVSASLVGGLAATPIVCTSEMTMDAKRESVKRYEENGKKGIRPTYVSTMKELWKLYHWKVFTLGLLPTAIREMKFTFAYDILGSYFANQLKKNKRFQATVEQQQIIPLDVAALILGGAGAGIIGAVASQPFDTWKTERQSRIKTNFWPGGVRKMVRRSVRLGRRTGRWDQATVRLFRNLTREPYKGFGPRSTRIVMAVIIFNLVPWTINENLKKYK